MTRDEAVDCIVTEWSPANGNGFAKVIGKESFSVYISKQKIITNGEHTLRAGKTVQLKIGRKIAGKTAPTGYDIRIYKDETMDESPREEV